VVVFSSGIDATMLRVEVAKSGIAAMTLRIEVANNGRDAGIILLGA